MMKAKKVAEIAGLKNGDHVAHGYTFDRDTIDIYYEDGEFVRIISNHNGEEIGEREFSGVFFVPNLFTHRIKRWYADRTHREIQNLFETFGKPLPLI